MCAVHLANVRRRRSRIDARGRDVERLLRRAAKNFDGLGAPKRIFRNADDRKSDRVVQMTAEARTTRTEPHEAIDHDDIDRAGDGQYGANRRELPQVEVARHVRGDSRDANDVLGVRRR